MDLDAVRKTVLNTAQSLHPGSDVHRAKTMFRRVPRQQLVSPNSTTSQPNWSTDMAGVCLAGDDNEVLVHEMPPGGFTFVVDD